MNDAHLLRYRLTRHRPHHSITFLALRMGSINSVFDAERISIRNLRPSCNGKPFERRKHASGDPECWRFRPPPDLRRRGAPAPRAVVLAESWAGIRRQRRSGWCKQVGTNLSIPRGLFDITGLPGEHGAVTCQIPLQEISTPPPSARVRRALAVAWWWSCSFKEMYLIMIRSQHQGPLDIYDPVLWVLFLIWLATRSTSPAMSSIDWVRLSWSWGVELPTLAIRMWDATYLVRGIGRQQTARRRITALNAWLRLPPPSRTFILVPYVALVPITRKILQHSLRSTWWTRDVQSWVLKAVRIRVGSRPTFLKQFSTSALARRVKGAEMFAWPRDRFLQACRGQGITRIDVRWDTQIRFTCSEQFDAVGSGCSAGVIKPLLEDMCVHGIEWRMRDA